MQDKQNNTRDMQERVRVLNRFRDMLMEQRRKFRRYLDILESMEGAIQKENTEVLLEHIRMEKQIAGEISTVQKVLNPLERMYKHFYPEQNGLISNLQKSLSELQISVLSRNAQNREILLARKNELAKSIKALKIPKTPHSVFGTKTSPTLVDIRV